MLTFTSLTDFAGMISPDVPRSAIKARLQHMQRLQFPAGVNFPGRRRERVSYDIDKTMTTGVVMALADIGLSMADAVAATRSGLGEIRLAYAHAAAKRYAIEAAPSRLRPRLLLERVLGDDGVAVRFDALADADTQSLGTVRLAAVIINLDALYAALEGVVPDAKGLIVAQAKRVLLRAGTRQLRNPDLSHLFGASE